MHTLVLSDSIRETNAYAESAGIRRVRHAAAARSIDGCVFASVVELPSFSKRRDQHAVKAAVARMLRKTPRMTYEVVEDWTYERPLPQAPAIEGEIPGQLTIEDAIAELEADEAIEPIEVAGRVNAVRPKDPEPKPAAKPKRQGKKPSPAKPKADSNTLEPADPAEGQVIADPAVEVDFFGNPV